ncbi:MAG: carbohydrate kinase [Myxococcota bacterium]
MPVTRKRPVLSVGEVLLDLAAWPPGTPLVEMQHLRPLQGGSPANVAVGLSRLGVPTALLGTVGTDVLGDWLIRQLGREGVETGLLARVPQRTGMVFLSVSRGGERQFLHVRHASADNALAPEHLPADVATRAGWLHFSSGPLRTPGGRRAIRMLRSQAARAGVPVSVDVNLRPGVWPSLEANAKAVWRASAGVDVLKANEDEAPALTGERNLERALRRMRAHAGRLAVITLGPRGAMALGQGGVVRVPSPDVRVVDTTGAGDAFMAGLLSVLAHATDWDDDVLTRALREGCRCGARVCTALGATTAMPRSGRRARGG